ncbi:MAG: hypothetical protein A2V66_16065 [Ignavibacteria bacterium RBG_13_36_8]|nr:MAG: hypothetical protein A2V66_16065 [Ignavibacteria bacterium RBG_13_36_8]
MKNAIFIFYLFVLTTADLLAQQNDFPKLTGPYLGQKPPSETPELFAPGLVSIEEGAEYGGNFSPDLTEFYFTRNYGDSNSAIWVLKIINGSWSEPKIVEFMDKFRGTESCLSPDGNYFYYVWVNKTAETVEHDIYIIGRTEHGWNTPERLTDVDLGGRRISPSVASNGNLYFSGDFNNPGQKDIYFSECINGRYSSPVNLGEKVNSEYHESHVYVSPDESYLLFDSQRPGGNGKTDIYISIKTKDGEWSEAINVGSPVNSKYSDWYPTVTPDGKYLMFSRNIDKEADIMWVDAKIIEELRPKE